MGNISNVFYTEVDDMPIEKAGEYYFHHNFVTVDDMFIDGYINYEEAQVELRNQILTDGLRKGKILSPPKVDTCIMGVSAIKNKVIFAVEW